MFCAESAVTSIKFEYNSLTCMGHSQFFALNSFDSTQFYNPPGGNLYCQCGVIFKTNDIQRSKEKKAVSERLFHEWMRKNRSVIRAGIY